MAINVGDNFNYQGKKYLDNRQSFKTLSELQAYTNVPEGFIAYCEEDKKRYEYIEGSWREYVVDSSAGGGETIDTSNFATKDELNTKFDDVLVNEEESTDGQTALDFFANGEKVKTVYFSGGGSGGAAAYISTVLPEENMVETGQNFDIIIDFYSPNPGNGTLKVFVNDVDAISTKIAQGESTTTLSYEKLTKGTNKIVVYVLDRIGTMSNSLTFYVRYGSTELVGEFDSSIAYDYGANIRYYFKATALDTSLTLTFYMSIDGAIQNGVNCISDVRGYFTFSNSLEAGGHYCECWVEDSKGGKSNVESFNLVILDTNTLAIVTETRNPSVEEGAQLVLDYRVYKKNETTFITKTYIDDELVSTGTCGLTKSYYKSSSLPEGMHAIKIEAWDITETIHDDVIWNVIITPSTYTMLQPIKAGSSFIATAVNRTNSDPNRGVWTGYNQDNTPIDATLVNFAFNSESGWMDDQIFITGKSHIEVPIKPLANNARYGFTLDIEFSSKPIGVDNAEVLTLWNDVDNCGIKITTDQLLLQSKTGNKCELYFSEEEIVSAIFVIDRNEKGAKIYLNGVMCAVFALSDYTAEGVSYLEDFTVDDYIYLGGKDKNGYSTIKNLRVYEIALSTDEILNNFMANEIDKTKQRELVKFQKGDDLPTVTVYCDFSGLGKDDKKYCDIVYNSPDPVKYGESFSLMGKYSQLQYQGTSSMQYPIKNYRLNPKDANGKAKIKLPNCQPETRFTLKADFMSSGHWQNTGLANWVNDNLYNYKEDDPKSMNPAKWWAIQNGQDPNDYRESIYGFPCRLILVNDGTTPLNAGQQEPTPGNTKDMGIFNFNLDKNCENTLGFKIKDFPNAVSMEVTANSDTSAGAFMSYSGDDYAGELAYIQESFEVRYGDEDTEGWGFMHVNNVEGTGIKPLIDWVDKSTDEQFVAEFEEHFHKDYTLRYFLLVMVLGMVDNLGKNMMLDSYDGKIWMPRFYDMDTICSYDNSGEIKFDVDIEMAQGYWNTSSSRLWTRVRDLFHDELISKYKDMRQNGMSYESFMNYFYDGQIAKIPQKYYNMDADVKYIPYLGEYAGKAHGDGYEHLKRWLKNRLIFTDTLYDYAPSYTNDMLTFRANTTEQMSITIETYTPVYQHVSWYNGQMDKEKIARGTTHTFTGFAQAATDQEILIYGGSNIKRIIGISSMNPNSMLIGNATRIVELDISNCPILTTVNSNKANFSPHTYLNKLDISNCPQLGGSLRLNYSPLIQEINAFNTAVTDLQLPSSLRNLTVLKLPHLLTTLTLNDASLLETLAFDDITNLTEVSMTNCNALKNMVNFDMTTVPKVTLNNSYDVDEMYMSATTDLSLVNMTKLKRLIYLPNNEHETFNLTQLRNYPNYNISAINCPSLKTFMTTAPYRDSYNVYKYKEILDRDVSLEHIPSDGVFREKTYVSAITGKLAYSDPGPIALTTYISLHEDGEYTLSCDTAPLYAQIIIYKDDMSYTALKNETYFSDVELPFTFKVPKGHKYIRFHVLESNSPTFVDRNNITGLSLIGPGTKIIQVKEDYGDATPNTAFCANTLDISNTKITDVNFLCTTDVYQLKLPDTVNNFICDSAYDLDTDYLPDGDFDTVHHELIEAYTTDYGSNVTKGIETEIRNKPFEVGYHINENGDKITNSYGTTSEVLYVKGGTTVHFESSTMLYSGSNGIRAIQYNDSDEILKINYYTGSWADYARNGATIILEPNTSRFRITVITSAHSGNVFTDTPITYITYQKACAPNLIPSAADGSLIFSMYAPNTNVAVPAEGIWDLYGLTFEEFYTYGMNNDIVENVPPETTIPVTFFNGYDREYTSAYIDIDDLLNDDGVITLRRNDAMDAAMIYFYKDDTRLSTEYFDTTETTITPPDEANRVFFLIIRPRDTTDFQSQPIIYLNNAFKFDIHVVANSTDLIVPIFEQEVIITMPHRYADYNITIQNANIKPTNYPTMLYPLLVNENKPIVGTIDYSDYQGDDLSYAMAYANKSEVDISIPNNIAMNTQYFHSIDTQSEYEYNDPRTIAKYTCNAKGVLPTFNSGYSGYIVDERDNGDGTYTTSIIADDISNLPTTISFKANTQLQKVYYLNTSAVTDLSYAFNGCSNLTFINADNLVHSGVKNVAYLFATCGNLESIDVSSWDTSNVTNMNRIFASCFKLSSIIGVDNWDISKVKDFVLAFSYTSIESLDVGDWDTSSVTNMNSMFNSCSSLTSLDVSNWKTSSVTNIQQMFYGCSKLTSLDFTGWNMSKINAFGQFCGNCTSLESVIGLNLSSDFNQVSNDKQFLSFMGCSSLKTIKDIDVSFTVTMGANNKNPVNDEQLFWVSTAWRWFRGLNNLEDISFKGQVGLWDTLSSYQILVACDTSKFTLETWNSFVSIFPETSTNKTIYMGKSQANLDAVPDSIKTALINKGYTLGFSN